MAEPYLIGEPYLGTVNLEPSMTVQAPSVDADINTIVARFGIGEGPMPVVPVGDQVYDFSDLPDLRESLERVRTAQSLFGQMPARVRTRFSNDPVSFLQFMQDPKNIDEAIALGVVEVKVTPGKADVPATPSA